MDTTGKEGVNPIPPREIFNSDLNNVAMTLIFSDVLEIYLPNISLNFFLKIILKIFTGKISHTWV